jgi:hypothetical protein
MPRPSQACATKRCRTHDPSQPLNRPLWRDTVARAEAHECGVRAAPAPPCAKIRPAPTVRMKHNSCAATALEGARTVVGRPPSGAISSRSNCDRNRSCKCPHRSTGLPQATSAKARTPADFDSRLQRSGRQAADGGGTATDGYWCAALHAQPKPPAWLQSAQPQPAQPQPAQPQADCTSKKM